MGSNGWEAEKAIHSNGLWVGSVEEDAKVEAR